MSIMLSKTKKEGKSRKGKKQQQNKRNIRRGYKEE